MKRLRKTGIAIDISPLEKDRRGMGFFFSEFLFHLQKFFLSNKPPFEISLAYEGNIPREKFPFPLIQAKEVNPSWLVWFPFNHPTFHPPGDYLVTLHDLSPFFFREGESKLRKLFIKGIYGARTIIVDSTYTSGEIQTMFGKKKLESKIKVIPPGFNAEIKREDSFEPPWPYLLAVGPAERRKNFIRLLQAFALLKKRSTPYKLVILGELPPWRKQLGPFHFEYPNPLPKLAKKLRVQDHIFFPGYLPRPRLLSWYKHALLAVVPTLYEGFGFPLLEAYSLGTPLACSRVASLPEVAGDWAFYFNPLDVEDMAKTIEHALTDKAAVERKRELAEIQLRKFSWETCIQSYLEVFQSALNEHTSHF